jgi:hypothetical protein
VTVEAQHYMMLCGTDMPTYCKCSSLPQVKSKDGALKQSMTTFFQILSYGLLNPRFLLQLEHCSIQMPIAAQHFAFWMKRM